MHCSDRTTHWLTPLSGFRTASSANLRVSASLRQATIACLVMLAAIGQEATNAAEPVVAKAQQRRVDVLKKISPAVVAIFGNGGQGGGLGDGGGVQ